MRMMEMGVSATAYRESWDVRDAMKKFMLSTYRSRGFDCGLGGMHESFAPVQSVRPVTSHKKELSFGRHAKLTMPDSH